MGKNVYVNNNADVFMPAFIYGPFRTPEAMLVGYFDNFVPGYGKIHGYGRIVDCYVSGWPNVVQEMEDDPNVISGVLGATNGYKFPIRAIGDVGWKPGSRARARLADSAYSRHG